MKHVGLTLVLAVLLLAACGDTINGKGLAETEVAKFRQLQAARKYDEIYENAGDELKKAASKEKLAELFAAIDRKLGALKSSKELNWKVNTYNLKTIAVLVQESVYERGAATETFTYVVTDGKAVMVGYHINSWDMLVK